MKSCIDCGGPVNLWDYDGRCGECHRRFSLSRKEVALSALLGFRLPPDAAKKFNRLKADDWTREDWADLLQAQQWVVHRVAVRHGIAANAWSHDPSDSEVSVDSVVGDNCRTCENNDADVAGDSGACVMGHGLCDPPRQDCLDYVPANDRLHG